MQGEGDQYKQYPNQSEQGLPPQNIFQGEGDASLHYQPPAEQINQIGEDNDRHDDNEDQDIDDDQNSDLLFEQEQPVAPQIENPAQAIADQGQNQQLHQGHVQGLVSEENQQQNAQYTPANKILSPEEQLLKEQEAQYLAIKSKSSEEKPATFYPTSQHPSSHEPITTVKQSEYSLDQEHPQALHGKRQLEHQEKKQAAQQLRQPQKSKNYNQILNPTTPSHSHYEENLKKIADLIKAGNIDQSLQLMEQTGIAARDFKYQAFQHNCIFFASVIKNDDLCKQAIQRFIEHGVDITYVDVLKQSILFYLAREGHTKCIQLAVENGCSGVNNADTYKQTPLYYAAREGNVEAAQRLMQLGANVEVEDHAQQSPLFYAAKSGKVEMVKLLIKWGANVNKKDKRKCTPLMQARRNNQNEVVQVLLQHGAISQPDPTEKKKAQSKKKSSQKKKVNIDKVSTKKYILHRQKENGQWEPVPQDEWESFKEQCPQVANYLENPQLLNKLNIPDIPDTMQLFDCWQKAAKKVIQVLWKHQGARIFHEPVDAEALQIPDYPDIVKNPMDFGTIKKKLNAFSYKNGHDFLKDMKLVFDNCILYNGANSEVGMIARSIEEEYNNQLEILNFNYYLK